MTELEKLVKKRSKLDRRIAKIRSAVFLDYLREGNR